MNGSVRDYFVECGLAGRPLNDCLVIDAHGHIDTICEFPYITSTVDSLIAAMDHLGVDRVYVSSTWSVFGTERAGNDHVIEALRLSAGRVRGYMALNVGYPETILPEMERCCAAGVRAVKIYSYSIRKGLRYDHPNYEIVYQFADEHGLPILAHTWGDELDQLEAAFRKYPKVNWILAHTGSVDLPKYLRAAREYGNVYLETCFSTCPRGFIELLCREVPLRKILWGSDEIFMNASQQLGRVLFAQISEGQKRAILGLNAQRVLECSTG